MRDSLGYTVAMTEPNPPQRPRSMTLEAVGREVADELFSFDRGFLHTFVRLWVEPLNVVRRYVHERDARLTRPVRYLLITVAITTAAAWLLVSQLGLARHLRMSPEALAQWEFLTKNTSWIVFLVLPFVILIIREFDRVRGDLAAVSAAAMVTYTQAQVLWVQLIVAVPLAYLPWRWPGAVAMLLISLWLYVLWVKHLGRPWWRSALGALLALVVAFVVNQLVIITMLHFAGLL